MVVRAARLIYYLCDAGRQLTMTVHSTWTTPTDPPHYRTTKDDDDDQMKGRAGIQLTSHKFIIILPYIYFNLFSYQIVR
jgi:hypothetical protein